MKKLFTIGLLLLCQLVAIAQNYTVTAFSNHPGACRFDMFNSKGTYTFDAKAPEGPTLQIAAGQEATVDVFPVTGFVLDSLVADGTQLTIVSAGYNNGKRGYFTMPDHNVSVMAYLHYAPTLPPNPSESGWDEETGSLLVNKFTTNSLLGAISSVVYNSATNNYDYAKVKAITVIGTLSRFDWEMLISDRFPNLTYLDVSRTAGLSTTSYDSYGRGYTLATVLLPATVSTIGSRTFYNFENLRSITCYAVTPPEVENNAFYNVPNDAIVYVPAESLPLYMEANVWKDFDLQPITKGVHKLTVNIPAAQGKALKDMFLELTNAQTSQTQRYVLTNSSQYTYNNLIDDTRYNIYIRNARGDILGLIENVEVKGGDVSVAFTEISTPQALTLQLSMPGGAPIGEDQFSVTWTDERGNYLAAGTTLANQLKGTKVKARVKLGEALGTQYRQPTDTLVSMGQASPLVISLQPLPQVTLSGIVTAEDTEGPIRGANIAVTQLLNGLYPVTLTATTDGDGHWTLTASDAATEITAQAIGYAPQKTTPDLSKEREVNFVLSELVGTTIRLDPYFRPAVRAVEESVSADNYEGLQDISYTVFDVTNNRELTNFTVQNGELVLQDQQLAPGTQVRITANSMRGEFAPASTTCTINADGQATATLSLLQLGQLIATFSQTDNMAVAGMLYDGRGELLGMDYYETPEEGSPVLTFTNLPDDRYTLVTMGESTLYNFVNTLAALTEMGLQEGRDYVKSEVNIAAGRIDSLHIQEVPMFDESVFSYTDERTSFRSNKQQLTIGTLATLQATVNFKTQVQPADVRLLFDLPEGCQFVDGSVMVGNSLAAYSFSDGRLSVPLAQAGDMVRFCVVPTAEAVYAPTASVSFTSGGKQVLQSLGTAIFTAQALSIEVPGQTPSGIVNVSGTAPAGSKVTIYDDDVLIGETEADVTGSWQQRCFLSNPFNLSEHAVFAAINTTDGMQLQSETRTVAVVQGTLSPVVTMSFIAVGNQQVVTWDFRSETVTPTSYVCQDTDTREPMNFDISFMNDEGQMANDTTLIKDIVLTVVLEDNSTLELYPRYNTKKGCWHAAYNIETRNMPINVYVDCLQDDDLKADRRILDNALAAAEASLKADQQLARDIYALLDREEEVENAAVYDELHELLSAETLDHAAVERIDRLVDIVLGDEAEDVPLAKQKEFDEMCQLLSSDATDEATMQRIYELQAIIDQANEQEDEKSDITALTDSINAHLAELQQEMLAFQRLYTTTDTTQWQRPGGDIEFNFPTDGGGNRHYSGTRLDNIDTEQLLAEGYTELKMTDGSSLYYLFEEGKSYVIDTKSSIRYAIEDQEGKAAAKFRAKAGTLSVKFIDKDSECYKSLAKVSMPHIGKFIIQLCGLGEGSTCYDKSNTYFSNVCVELNDGLKALKCIYDVAMADLRKFADEYYKTNIEESEKYRRKLSNQIDEKTKEIPNARTQFKTDEIAKDLYTKKRDDLLKDLAKATKKNDINEINRINIHLQSVGKKAEDYTKAFIKSQNHLNDLLETVRHLKSNKVLVESGLSLLKTQQKLFNLKMAPVPKVLTNALKSKWVLKLGEFAAKIIGTPVGALLQIGPLFFVTSDIIMDAMEWDKLNQYMLSKLPCPAMDAEAKMLHLLLGTQATNFGKASLTQWLADVTGLLCDATDLPIAAPQWYFSVGCDLVSVVISLARPWASEKQQKMIRRAIDALECKEKPKKDPKPTKPKKPTTTTPPSPPASNSLGAWHRWGNQTDLSVRAIHTLPNNPLFDPSGYVYEAVGSNRLEGVTATCYHKQTRMDEWGDLYEDEVVWNAEPYRQQNPLITDAEGRYAWDVPQGLWQVRYEKDGYELKRSEWLPVPPPQLDVNVGMTQLRQPQVSRVKAYPEGIDMTFDKYMRPHTMTTEQIFVTKGGQNLRGTIQLLNAESGYETPDSFYVSKVRFVPSTPLYYNEKVQLTIRRTVESYAGLQMEQDYTQEFQVEPCVAELLADSLLNMADGATQAITIRALPAEAAKGKRISATATSSGAIAISDNILTLDESGQAQLNITAASLGAGIVTFSLMDDDELQTQTIVFVNDSANMVVESPVASRMSGTEIYRGAEIKLTCPTAGSTILYTLDGSCPCEPQSASVFTYRGPIMATGDSLVIRAMAVAPGMGESEAVEFHYKVIDNPVGIESPYITAGTIGNKAPVMYFRLDGRRTTRPQKGINIVRYANGNVRKMVVK